MSRDERLRISKTMAFLLRHRPDVGGLRPDPEGWVPLAELRVAVERLLHTGVEPAAIDEVAADPEGRFERREADIRATRLPPRPRPPGEQPPREDRGYPPDILYHATTDEQIAKFRDLGQIAAGEGRRIFLSTDESQAWRVAHRLAGGPPRVLYVDAARARRHGVRFWKNRKSGLFHAVAIPFHDVLNLQEGFAEQVSAGGIPVVRDETGSRLALIRVTRRSGATWEVAKGKLEPGEPPEVAAVREVREEMGVHVDLRITRPLGTVRYGFLAPGGLPRLKTVHLFLMEPTGAIGEFTPAEAEGIAAVKWFSPHDAMRAVTHSSLIPLLREVGALFGAPSDDEAA